MLHNLVGQLGHFCDILASNIDTRLKRELQNPWVRSPCEGVMSSATASSTFTPESEPSWPPLLRARRRPRQARSHMTVSSLLDATALVLLRRGYAACTTNLVAEVAGVGIGSLYE